MYLPADLLLLIAEEVRSRHDFNTLLSCALTGKRFAKIALLNLYQIHNDYLRIISSEGTDAEWHKTQAIDGRYRTGAEKRTVSKWVLLWKSIARSSLGTTAYPYALYINSLDLGNLSDLLDDILFENALRESFFADDMQTFLYQGSVARKQTRARLEIQVLVNRIGNSICAFASKLSSDTQTSIALESLSGNIGTAPLTTWTQQLHRLRTLSLWNGAILNGDVAAAISRSCSNFDELSMYSCEGNKTSIDYNLSGFFAGLRPNTMRYSSFSIQTSTGIGKMVLSALAAHSDSLKILKLGGLQEHAVKSLSCLQECKRLEVLELEDSQGVIDLEATEYNTYLAVKSWLAQCSQLQELSFIKLANAPDLVKEVCTQSPYQLKRLKVINYPLSSPSSSQMHRSLLRQTGLVSLSLRADPVDCTRNDIDDLVYPLRYLSELKDLDLLETSDYFIDSDIQELADNLPLLEKFSFAGSVVTDDIWPDIARMHYLKDLNINAVTSFTVSGLLDYIDILQPTNQGLLLSVMYQSPLYPIFEEEKTLIQKCIAAKVDGKFDFALSREGADSDYDESDSD